jgi:DNA-binding transcriptional LysR family regulator
LIVLDALLAEGHLTRAAARLHKSQPAVSHALARLRESLGDDLFVRVGGRLKATPRAQALRVPLADVLAQIGALLAPVGFDPARANRVFRVAMSDYGARQVLPALLPVLRQAAPGIDLVVTQASRAAMQAQVADGEIDLALGVFPDLPPTLAAQTLFVEDFSCLADAATLPPEGALTLADWLSRPHALVAMAEGADNEIDRALHQLRQTRRIALTLPHWGLAGELIAGSDLILTIATRALTNARQDKRLKVFAPPLALASFEFQQIWRPLRDGDPGHVWLRQQVAQAANSGIKVG